MSGRERQGKRVDLDAAHKARAEKVPAPVVKLGGEEFVLPSGTPAVLVIGLARAANEDLDGVEEALTALFGDRTPEVLKLGFAVEDIEVILEQAYSESAGEAPASGS